MSVTTSQDDPLTITVTGSDPDGDDLSFELWAKNVTYGSLALPFVNTQCSTDPETGVSTCTAQTTYTPSGDYVGQDSFGYGFSDGQFCGYGGVNITVTGEQPASEVTASPAILDFGARAVGQREQRSRSRSRTTRARLCTWTTTRHPRHSRLAGVARGTAVRKVSGRGSTASASSPSSQRTSER